MEDLIGLVVVILYFVIALAASRNKKKKKHPTNAARAKRRAVMERAFSQMETALNQATVSMPPEFTQEGKSEPRVQPEQVALEFAQEGEDPCHSDLLGEERPAMRTVSVPAAALAQAAEGEDPCHIGGTREADDPMDAYTPEMSPIFDTDDRDALTQDILRGVIMSEILARPGRRRVTRQR